MAPAGGPVDPGQAATPGAEGVPGIVMPGMGSPLQIQGTVAEPQVINLIRVPGSQQVLLKVRVAELNRTALRRIGANFLGVDPSSGAIFGTQIAGPVSATGFVGNPDQLEPGRILRGAVASGISQNSTAFGIFQSDDFEFTLNALRATRC